MNWDNALDVASWVGVISVIRLCVYYARRSNDIQTNDEPYSTFASLIMAALFFGAAYALHAHHAAYYILLGWYAEAFFQPIYRRSKYIWTILFTAYGTACVVLLNNFWIVLGAWTVGMIAIVTVAIPITIKAYRRDG